METIFNADRICVNAFYLCSHCADDVNKRSSTKDASKMLGTTKQNRKLKKPVARARAIHIFMW